MPALDDERAAPGDITRSLREWHCGDEDALSRLTAAVYGELRRLASSLFAAESGDRTLQPTALVHELYLQLPSVQHLDWQSRAQFLSVAAKNMRNILVDHARKLHAGKRGGGVTPVIVDAQIDQPALKSDVLVINDALDRLSDHYPRSRAWWSCASSADLPTKKPAMC